MRIPVRTLLASPLLLAAACDAPSAPDPVSPPAANAVVENVSTPAPPPPTVANPDDVVTPVTAQELETYPQVRDMPPDVARFMIRHADCAHFLGEPAFDEQRRRDLEKAVAEICPGIDALGQTLRARHRDNVEVIRALNAHPALSQ